jgi:drug/metabolite transporter (DMT)-like permease
MRTGSEARVGAVCGLVAAALFGASAPLAKRLLPDVAPIMLAGLLYGGAGLALSLVGAARRRGGAPNAARAREAGLRAGDVGLLGGIVALGGVVGPILMLLGLGRTSGIGGALLLNLEAPLTAMVAVLFFGEHLGRRAAAATAVIVAGAAVLGGRPGAGHTDWLGAVAIAGACLAWAVDNNLTQRLSVRDPIAVVRVKTLGAGACNLALALATGARLPSPRVAAAALAVGAASYGASVVLDVYALRLLGAAREAAYFATAPFAGALVAIPVLGERPGGPELAGAALMVAGVVLMLRERHGHVHTHEPIEHDHLHVHDEHHTHRHDPPVVGAHAHMHKHEALTHDHPHSSDVHHRHRH